MDLINQEVCVLDFSILMGIIISHITVAQYLILVGKISVEKDTMLKTMVFYTLIQ